MEELFVVNPRDSKGRFIKARKRRRQNPGAKSARRRRRTAKAATPKRRRRRATKHTHWGKVKSHRRRVNPSSSRRRRRRRNPTLNLRAFSPAAIIDQVIPASIGAAGAVALDVAIANLPLPDQLKVGYSRHAVRAVGAIALGMLSRYFVRPETAARIGSGALTVVMYGVLKDLIRDYVPAEVIAKVPGLSDVPDYTDVQLDYMNPAPGIEAYLPTPGLTAYMDQPGVLNDYEGAGFSDNG